MDKIIVITSKKNRQKRNRFSLTKRLALRRLGGFYKKMREKNGDYEIVYVDADDIRSSKADGIKIENKATSRIAHGV